jgi:hypothetical protein
MSGTDRAHELGAFLAGIPFFASFDEGTLVWLARHFEPVHAQAGDAVIAEHVDLLLRPPVPAIGAYDFKAGAALIETGYRHAAEALADSGIPGRFR